MLSDRKLQVTLEEVKEISRIDLALYSDKGELLASTYEPQEGMGQAVCEFAGSMAESQALLGCHFFKILVEDKLEYILLARAGIEEAYMIGRLAACQIRNIACAYRDQSDRGSFIRDVVLGNMPAADVYNKAEKLHIEAARRVVFVIEVSGKKDSVLLETVKNLFVTAGRDFVWDADGQSIILVKDVRGMESEEELKELAEMLADNLHTEVMVKVRVGYGNRVELLADIARSYQEAKMALAVGRIFYMDRDTVSYRNLGIGRLIYQLPENLCEIFLKEVFGENTPDGFDEETMITVNKFFENNLNISETARQLYVHRNTLVYRLERIEKSLGLDIRLFEDAMLFKIALMVISYMNYLKTKDMQKKADIHYSIEVSHTKE